MITQPKTLAEVKADHRVAHAHVDVDGVWIDLAPGWRNTYDTSDEQPPVCDTQPEVGRRGARHGIYVSSEVYRPLREALLRFPDIKPCRCAECKTRITISAGTGGAV
jgi:hypothetical protein